MSVSSALTKIGDKMFKPGDLVIAGNEIFEVTGNFTGGTDQTNLVGLMSLYYRAGCAYGTTQSEMFVPEAVLTMAVEGGGRHIPRPLDPVHGTRHYLCATINNGGPNGEPLACGFPYGHDGPHSWASLPTFARQS
jgi:hypothetical protein